MASIPKTACLAIEYGNEILFQLCFNGKPFHTEGGYCTATCMRKLRHYPLPEPQDSRRLYPYVGGPHSFV